MRETFYVLIFSAFAVIIALGLGYLTIYKDNFDDDDDL